MTAVKGGIAAVMSVVTLWIGAVAAAPQQMRPPGDFEVFPDPAALPKEPSLSACFLLFDVNGGEVRRSPAQGCARRVAPGETFEIAANLAALDAGTVRGNAATRGAQNLEAALGYAPPGDAREQVQNLGAGRMGEYLSRFTYGNADTRSGGEYWNGGSLEISPSEQMHFLSRLFRNELPASRQAMTEVQSMLGQPPEVMVGRNGVAIVRVPRVGDTSVIGKSASLVVGNEAISWQVGQIDRGSRRFVFVSCVTGPRSLPRNAAAVLAEAELRNGGAL